MVELNHSICYKDVLTSEWNSSKVLHQGHMSLYFLGKWKDVDACKTHKDENWALEVSWKPWALNQKKCISLEKICVHNFLLNTVQFSPVYPCPPLQNQPWYWVIQMGKNLQKAVENSKWYLYIDGYWQELN